MNIIIVKTQRKANWDTLSRPLVLARVGKGKYGTGHEVDHRLDHKDLKVLTTFIANCKINI